MAMHRRLEAGESEQQGAEQEADALHRVFRSGQQRHPAEQRPLLVLRGQNLDRALRAHLGEVLGDARHALHRHHEDHRADDGPGRIELRQRQERTDLQRQACVERRGQAKAGRDPAGREIGDDPGDLVEQEKVCELDRREPEPVEVQEHQHPQRPVGEHERPIGAGDGGIGRVALRTGGAGLDHHVGPATSRATSARRQA